VEEAEAEEEEVEEAEVEAEVEEAFAWLAARASACIWASTAAFGVCGTALGFSSSVSSSLFTVLRLSLKPDDGAAQVAPTPSSLSVSSPLSSSLLE
jgi:membrane associated rhomboid family serine protease